MGVRIAALKTRRMLDALRRRLNNGREQETSMTISGLGHVKISCSDVERTAAFYARFGYEAATPVTSLDEQWVSDLYGAGAARPRAIIMVRAGDRAAPQLELIEWRPAGAVVAGPTSPGAGGIGLNSDDIFADTKALRAQGCIPLTEPLSRPAPKGTMWLVNFPDPDGHHVQLLQYVRAAAPAAG